MIQVDISNVWGQLSLPDLLAMEKEIAQAHERITGTGDDGKAGLYWLDLPEEEPSEQTRRILQIAEKIRGQSDVCVVLGVGGNIQGSRAAAAFVRHMQEDEYTGPELLYMGSSLSTRYWNEQMRLLENKDFSVIVISGSGTTLEPALAFRSLRWILERRYGSDKARERIYAVTDPSRGALRQMVREEGWESFPLPDGIGGSFSVLSPAGLLPMAVAGVDIIRVLQGAADIRKECDLRSFENPVWLYAAVRNLLYRSGKAVELLVSFEPGMGMFGAWWQQLFARSEGKNGKGLFPVPVEMTSELYSLGQLIQSGERNLFETMIRFLPPRKDVTFTSDWKNLDGLNYLEGKTLDHVEQAAYQSLLSAHADGGVPVLTVECGEPDARTLGQLFCFMELSCGISSCVMGADPDDRSGIAAYKQNLFALLGRPGYEP